MRFHDYRCQSCGTTGEFLLDEPVDFIRCTCGGSATRVWLKAPGIKNKMKGLFPQYDMQLGVTVDSPQHRDRILKERGLTAISKKEFDRMPGPTQPEDEVYIEKNAWREAAEKAYNDIKFGNVPAEVQIPTVNDLEVDQPLLISQQGA